MDIGPQRLLDAGLMDDIRALGWKAQLNDKLRFEAPPDAEDQPIGILKRPRYVCVCGHPAGPRPTTRDSGRESTPDAKC